MYRSNSEIKETASFRKIKNKFRVHQINEKFYIQEKEWYGWSYDNYNEWNTGYISPWRVSYRIVPFIFLGFSLIIYIVKLAGNINHTGHIILYTSLILFFLTRISYIILSKTYKKLACINENLRDSEDAIDSIVMRRTINLDEKEKEKEARKQKKEKLKSERKKPTTHNYHYFYDERTLRAKKLKKISRT